MTFDFHRFRFQFQAIGSVSFPAGKAANVIRGTFGLMLREVAPATDYTRIFEPKSEHGPSGLADPPRPFVFRYSSAEHWLEAFRNYYGPMLKASAALDEAGQVALADDRLDLARRFHQGGTGLAAPSTYLEVVMTRRADG